MHEVQRSHHPHDIPATDARSAGVAEPANPGTEGARDPHDREPARRLRDAFHAGGDSKAAASGGAEISAGRPSAAASASSRKRRRTQRRAIAPGRNGRRAP